MKYLFINSVYGLRSTGKIIADKCHELKKQGHSCVVAYGREAISDPEIKTIQIGGAVNYLVHAAISRIFDNQGFMSAHATRVFLKHVEADLPDVIWFHNLHGYYINVEILFDWIKKHPDIQVYWTLHDCWPFTGHCSHFTVAKCEKWKTFCRKCTQKREYPTCLVFDRSQSNFQRKKQAFTGVKNMTLVVPSRWLAGLLSNSFLREYPVLIQPNEINRNVFKPTPGDFRKRYGLESVYIVLGVAVGWESTKGFGDILLLRKLLDEKFVIVLVGLTKKQISTLPQGIVGIERTKDQTELAQIYTTADVFVNPTHQDNYPTVNLEARACGTPVVTYNVGGSPESAGGEHVVNEGDVQAMAEKICELAEKRPNGSNRGALDRTEKDD